jgi:hypothetical protein
LCARSVAAVAVPMTATRMTPPIQERTLMTSRRV